VFPIHTKEVGKWILGLMFWKADRIFEHLSWPIRRMSIIIVCLNVNINVRSGLSVFLSGV
jgi:hypothetical protein